MTSSESNDQKKIVGVLRHAEGRKRVIVAIAGKPDDLTVDFIAGETAQLVGRFASLVTYFGAGALELQSLKKRNTTRNLKTSSGSIWKTLFQGRVAVDSTSNSEFRIQNVVKGES